MHSAKIELDDDGICQAAGKCKRASLDPSDWATIFSVVFGFVAWWSVNRNAQVATIHQVFLLASAAGQYYVGAWCLERLYAHKLWGFERSWKHYVELLIRLLIFLTVIFGLFALESNHGDLFAFVIILFYLLLLCWDAFVYWGGVRGLVSRFLVYDILGIILASVMVADFTTGAGHIAFLALLSLTVAQIVLSLKKLRL